MDGRLVETTRVAVRLLHPAAQAPRYSSAEAAGADLYASESRTILPGHRCLVPTGVAIELVAGLQAEIRPRSGLALKHGITVLNTPGTVDSDYRGEVGVILFNAGNETFTVKPGDRIAQMVIMPVVIGSFEVTTEELSSTERGEGGYGSTGV